MAEMEFHIQAIVSIAQEEWPNKANELEKAIAYMKKRGDYLEWNAAERLMLLGEFENLIEKLLTGLKHLAKKCVMCEGNFCGECAQRKLPLSDAVLVSERVRLMEEADLLEEDYFSLLNGTMTLKKANINIKKVT
uniref:SPOC domain-containing protein n=2 Tax=Parascaris univalens TaxID=6257 RepID=A0A914ZZ76_PARUN